MIDSKSNSIGENLDKIRDLLNVAEGPSEYKTSIDFAWYVGATGENDDGIYTDFSDTYINEGRWENRWNDKFISDVKQIKKGDRIALKASYTKKKGLPFNNNGKTVAVMSIKAIGTVVDNLQDGKNIKVLWQKINPVKEWYGPGTLRSTIHLVKANDGFIKKALLKFTFENEKQDYAICEDQYKIDTLTEEEILLTHDDTPNDYSVEQLGDILADMYNSSEATNKTTGIHMFGVKYGEIIIKNSYSRDAIITRSGISESYIAELNKGINLYKAIKNNEYGVAFYEDGTVAFTSTKSLPPKCYPRNNGNFPLNTILYGAPGTGKTYSTAQYALAIIENKGLADIKAEPREDIMTRYNSLVSAGQIVFTTFHQNYGYEDFIQGIRPDISTAGGMAFKTVDGVFKSIADKAMNDPNKDYVIIIDEINRANISKVFGELITLIEDDKRWGEENAISATLPSGEIFAVPNNLYIVGTMNSADKSISLIDSALRRRFIFIECIPNLDLVENSQLRLVLEKLNMGIAKELNGTDLLIGHSYFMKKQENDLCDIMNQCIIPLLYEYFFDNQKKVKAQLEAATEGIDVEVKESSLGRITLVKKESK